MRRLAPIAFLIATPGFAQAAGEGGSEVRNFLWSVFNLALLLAAIAYFARKPIRDYFAARRRQVGGELDAAAELLRQAEARLAEWQSRVDRLDAALADIRETARRRSERILAQAHATAERIRQDAGAAVERELSRARERLREEAAALAVELASGILEKQVTAADRKRLVDDFIARVEQAPSGAAEG